VNPKLQIIESNYEPGELIDGQPIEFDIEYSAFNWQPEYELSDGLKKTIYWFKNNLWRYI
ncbi:MAG: hypothetical protein QXL84_06745, partial [Thermoplasmata archaeon]